MDVSVLRSVSTFVDLSVLRGPVSTAWTCQYLRGPVSTVWMCQYFVVSVPSWTCRYCVDLSVPSWTCQYCVDLSVPAWTCQYCVDVSVLRSVSTFVDVSKHVQLGLHPPLDGVQQLHAPHPLHLLRHPVQETCAERNKRTLMRQRVEQTATGAPTHQLIEEG